MREIVPVFRGELCGFGRRRRLVHVNRSGIATKMCGIRVVFLNTKGKTNKILLNFIEF